MQTAFTSAFRQKTLDKSCSEIIRTLVYFDIFKHPLTRPEIERFSQFIFEEGELDEALDFLLKDGVIYSSESYFLLHRNHHPVQYRKLGNQRAENILPTAKKYAKWIASFPFVRAVFISGSLSKGVMQKDSDLDFFIITASKRLWLARTLLILYKKIFLLNSHKYFCLNYFITEKNLNIPDKNLFTAIELVTLLPMHNLHLYDEFLVENKWALDFFPNAAVNHKNNNSSWKEPLLKSFLEKVLGGKWGNRIDTWCMRITNNFWRKKYVNNPKVDFQNSIRSSKDVSKYHPNYFQHKTLSLYETGLQTFELVTGYKLTK